MFNRLRNIKLPGGKGVTNALKAVAGLGVLGWAGYESVYTVEGGHRAVVYSRFTGVGEKVYEEGLHFKIPCVGSLLWSSSLWSSLLLACLRLRLRLRLWLVAVLVVMAVVMVVLRGYS